MALRNARDVYTRRRRASRSGSSRAGDITASQPRRAGRVLRPGGRQDLPAPDVLRRARGGRVPVSDAVTDRARLDVPPRARPTTRWSTPSGWASGSPTPRRSRRTWRSATSASTCSARPGLSTPTPARSTAPAAARTTSPCCATSASGATSTSSSRSAATSPTRWPGCCGSRPTRSSSTRRCRLAPTTSLAGVAAKAVKEVRYHLDHAAPVGVRLGDGTEESHRRMQAALDARAALPRELFDDDEARAAAARRRRRRPPRPCTTPSSTGSRASSSEATLTLPDGSRWRSRGGRPASTRGPWATSSPRCSTSHRSHPGGDVVTRRWRAGRRAVAQAISRIPDPEVPVISIADLGILRAVDVDEPAAPSP